MPYKARENTRENMTKQVTQTAALAAFIGGFAYTGLEQHSEATLDIIRYVLTCFSVHCCMCSTLTSAILYTVLENLHDDEFDKWCNQPFHRFLLSIPAVKFGLGCVVFLLTVMLKSWHDMSLYNTPISQYATLAMGCVSVSMITMTYIYIYYFGPGARAGVGAHTKAHTGGRYGTEAKLVPVADIKREE